MKNMVMILVMFAIFGASQAIAGLNPSATISVDKHKAVNENGNVFIPLTLENTTSVKAARIVFEYEGEISKAEFKPADFLHAPLFIAPRIDPVEQTISISVAATEKVVSRQESGVIGFLVVDQNTEIESLKIIEADLVNENYQVDVIVKRSSGGGASRASAGEELTVPEIKKTQLFQSYPNPANPTSTISFDLKNPAIVRLEIFDVNGRLVRSLVHGKLGSNHYEIKWDGRGQRGERVSSGVYFYRLHAGGHVETKKLIILK